MAVCSAKLERCGVCLAKTILQRVAAAVGAPLGAERLEKPDGMAERMSLLSSVSDAQLLTQTLAAARAERAAMANVLRHLAEVDRRRLYLDQACSSLYSYCIERLGYSEDAALKRVRVARLIRRFPSGIGGDRNGSHSPDRHVSALSVHGR